MEIGIVLGVLALVAAIGLGFPDLIARIAPPLIYYPARLSEPEADPAAWGLAGAEAVDVKAGDGVRLHGWWVPASGPERCGVAIFFHGNAGNIASRGPIAERFASLGVSTLLVDYRGYGRSEGKPSEEGLYRDGLAAYRYVREERGVPAGELVLVGNSLGAAVATHVAALGEAGGLVISGAFRSVPDLARALYWWMPSGFFRWSFNRFDNEGRIAGLGLPVLVARAGDDSIVPRVETRSLYEEAPEPKRWVEVEGADHNDLWWSDELWRELGAFVDRHIC